MTSKYIGERYVPLYIGVHDDTIEYEPLSIVSNTEKTETFTSKRYVPAGIELSNETYWAQSGFSNAGLEITSETDKVASTVDSELVTKKTAVGYHLTLNDSNSFQCGGKFGDAMTLNTVYTDGRYMIKPSVCTGVPSEIASITNPSELIVTNYDNSNGEINFCQKLTTYDDDNAATFIRTHNDTEWSDWKMIGGNGSAGEWVNITDQCTFNETYARKHYSSVWKNDTAKLCWIHMNGSGLMDNVEVGAHSINATIISGMPKAQNNPNDEILFSGCAPGTSNVLPWVCTIKNNNASNLAEITFFQYYSLFQGASNSKIEILYRIE